MTTEYNRNSYRDADVGETYSTAPRVNSSHLRSTYSRLVQVTDNIDFNSPIFDGMLKRNRSLGSGQAFIVEIALADKRFVDEMLKPFCIGEGSNILLGTHYMDNIYFDRLEAYTAKQRRRKVVETLPSPTVLAQKQTVRAYFPS